jgi:uncharacterized delta-60 repeat protein
MVTSIGGVPFGSILYIDGVSINNIVSYMGTTITPPLPDYLYVGGNFTTYKQPIYSRIIRTDLSGSIDTTFNMGNGFPAGGFPTCMVTQSDGKIIIGGNFSTYSGSINAGNLIRLNTNGTRDTTFIPGAGFNGQVNTIAIQPDGKIIAVGAFTTYSGSTRNRIVRLNTNGTYDTTFNIGTGLNNTANCVAIQSDGKILVGGATITQYSGSLIGTGSLRINTNGTRDTTFNTGVGFLTTSTVNSIDIQSDGKIVVGGAFTSYSGSTVTRLTRLNDNGSVDTTFNPGTINNEVFAVKIQPDQKILIQGQFTTVSGSTRTRIARVLSNGQVDTSYDVGTGINVASSINIFSLDTSGNVYVGGAFTTYNGSTVNRFVKTTPSGTIDGTFISGSIAFNGQSSRGFNGTVRAVLVSGSNIYMGGEFTTYQAPPINYIVKLDNTGAVDTTFNMGAGPNSTVTSMVTQSDGKLLIASSAFQTYSGSSAIRIARINPSGTLDTTFNVGAGLNGVAYDMKIQPDGKIVAAGTFTTYSGSTNSGIVRINTNGTKDTTFNVGVGSTGAINQLALQSDGKIIAIGATTAYSGSSNAGIVRINTDGTKDTTFNIGTGFNATTIYAIGIQSTGKIIVGGNFSIYSGSTNNYIVRINTDGTKDTTFNIGTGFGANGVVALKVLADDSIIAYGSFTTFSGSASPRIIRLNPNGTKDTTFAPTTGFSAQNPVAPGYVQALSIDKNNNIYVGNQFLLYNNNIIGNIVKMNQLAVYDSTFNQGSVVFNGTGIGFNGAVASIINLIT